MHLYVYPIRVQLLTISSFIATSVSEFEMREFR